MGCGISKIDLDEARTKFNRPPKRNVDSHAPVASSDVSDDLSYVSLPNRNDRKSVSSNKGETNCQVHEVNARKSSANRSGNNNNERRSVSSPIGNNERISVSSPIYINERRSVSSQVGNKGEIDHRVQEVVNAKKGEANCNVSSPVGNKSELDHHQAEVYGGVNANKAAVDNCKDGFGVGNGRKYNQELAAKAMKGVHRKHGHEEYNYRDDSIVCPGSPSFREYCVSDGSGSGKGKNEDRIGAKGENCKSPRENNKSQPEGSLNSEMGSEQADSTKKRKSIGKGIRNAVYKPAEWMSRQK